MSKHVSKPVDMSLPPEDRRRRRPGRVVVTPPALMVHGTSPRARSRRRDGERWLAAEASRRATWADVAAAAEQDADD